MRTITTATLAAFALTLSACGGDAEEVEEVETETPTLPTSNASDVDFGTDSGDWANDGECDDARFEGPGMTDTELLQDDIMSDASDCRAAYENGTISLRDEA